MRLKEYLKKYATPVSVLARRANMSISTLHKIVAGSEPMLRCAVAIEDATEGAVSCRELLRQEGEMSPAQVHTLKKAANNKDSGKKKNPKKSKD